MATPSLSYVERARQYAEQVIAGDICACKWVRAACERQLRDRERFASDAAPYYFDERRASRPCRVIEGFAHVKGQWARGRQRIELEPWQLFALTTVFGWMRRDTNARRFRIAYNEMARKNGKTATASGLGVFLTACDGEPGAVVVSAATTRDQAKLCFNDAQLLAKREPGFRRLFGVNVLANAIVQERTGSSFKPLSAEGQHQDGLNIHGAIIDEFHAHKDRRVWDVIETATGSRLQSLIWIITTAGFNLHGICYEMRSYVQKVLDGTVTDDSIFAAIYTLDDGDEWHDRRTWIKANPNLGVSVYADDIERQAAKAAVMPAALTNFLTKRLNCWVTASTQWIDARVWQKAAQPGPALAGMRYQSCYIGLDLATKNDLAALCLWFPPAGERRTHRLFFKLYVPEAALDREENAKLAEFARAGHIQIHRGPVCDYEALADDLDECGATYDVREIAGDPWQLPPLYSVVKRRSLEAPIVEVRQIVATLSPAMKETIALLLTGAIEHDGNPAVAWMVSNVVCHLDSKENWYPTKTHRANKIDAPIAMFIAAARIVGAYGADALAYENAREFKSVGVVAPPATNAAHSSLDELLRGL